MLPLAPTQAWNQLTTTSSSPVVLCSDFTATGRSVATFTDLAQASGLPAGFLETAAPPAGAEAGLGADGYVRWWTDELPAAGAEVVAVTGFCVGAVFAAPIYSAVCARQATPPLLLLFDPERPSAQLLLRHFRELLLGMDKYLDATELAAVNGYCKQAPMSAGMTELATWFADRFTKIATTALQRIGLDAEYSAEVAATFRSFINYLAAASGIDPTPAWQQATAFSSVDAHSGLNPLPPAERAAAVATEHRFDLHHTTLLSDPAVAGRVRDLLQVSLPTPAQR